MVIKSNQPNINAKQASLGASNKASELAKAKTEAKSTELKKTSRAKDEFKSAAPISDRNVDFQAAFDKNEADRNINKQGAIINRFFASLQQSGLTSEKIDEIAKGNKNYKGTAERLGTSVNEDGSYEVDTAAGKLRGQS